MTTANGEEILGKYKVIDYTKPNMPNGMYTDNAREAVWEANKKPDKRRIENICGEKEFYRDEEGRWRSHYIE